MKLLFSMASIFVVSVGLFASTSVVSGQAPILVENFDYAAGQLLTNNGWTAHSGAGTNAIATVSPGLTFANYPSSGVGNAIAMTVSGEDDNRPFAVQSTGSVYAAFMVNISEAAVDSIGGYFFHLGPDPVSTTFRGRVFVKKDGSNNLSFGLSKAATGDPNVAFTPFSFSLNTTYLIVLKYAIVDGATNDVVTMYINPTLPGTEPGAPALTAIDVTATDISPGTVSVRQGTTTTSPTMKLDGIRVGTSWESVTASVPTESILDYDGDGKTDWAITRDEGGRRIWWVQHNGSATNQIGYWGLATDAVVAGDFDGDGRADFAVYRFGAPKEAAFYILESGTSTLRVELFGQYGDRPELVADYDGDGKTDVAVYRAGATAGDQSFYFFRGSMNNPSGNVTYVPWGLGSDQPAPGDFDGDGKNDFAVRRALSPGNDASAQFIILRSSDLAVEYVNWGLISDTYIPGDYDGDGMDDFCVVRVGGGLGNFYILERDGGGTGANPIVFGSVLTDFLAPGDYDGDGRQDIAIWRANANPDQNYFYVRRSSDGGLTVFEWGQQSDVPVGDSQVFGGFLG